jgi:hypothetical protein
MSSNANHTIDLNNYEEWFILFMDEELGTEEKRMVENFLLLHPHLQEELDLLLSTRLPVDDGSFFGKESLKADAMKLNAVDENLLLYLDNELSSAAKKAVEEKLASDQNYHYQHRLLQQAKLDGSDSIPYPNKAELYRHTERVIFFPLWLRVAVAVVIILFSAFFFVFTADRQPAASGDVVKQQKPVVQPKTVGPENDPVKRILSQPQQTATVKTTIQNKTIRASKAQQDNFLPRKKTISEQVIPAVEPVETVALQKADAVHIDVAKAKAQPALALNIPIAIPAVTSAQPATYNDQRNPEVTAGMEGEERSNRTPAKGFLRKVSRFLERRTGIGTVNADNELLVGAVALKLN